MGVSLDDKTKKWHKWYAKFIKVPAAMDMIEQMTKNLYCSFNRTEKIIIVSYIKQWIIQSSVEKIFKEYLKMHIQCIKLVIC